MFSNRPALSIALSMAMAHAPAFSAIEGFSFIDTLETSKSIKRSTNSATLLNNTSLVAAHVSAGLDRRIRVSVETETEEISSFTTDVVTVNDVLSPFGTEFFGFSVPIDLPEESKYKITAETISLSGDVVDTVSTEVIRDITPPGYGEKYVKMQYGGHINSLLPPGSWYLSHVVSSVHTILNLPDIIDESSIVSAIMETFTIGDDGTRIPYRQQEMTYSPSLSYAQINLNTHKTMFPHGDSATTPFEFRIRLEDQAGNVSYTPKQTVYYDTVLAETLEAYAVKVPGSENVIAGEVGFEPYSRNMEIDTNPATVMYRVEDWNHRDSSGNFNNAGGLLVSGADKVITDQNDGYVYYIDTGEVGRVTITWRIQADYRSASGNQLYSFVLSDIAPQTPTALRGEYWYSDLEDYDNWSRRVMNTELPVSIEKMRLGASMRSYDQKATHSGHECIIPAGEQYCEVEMPSPWVMTKGNSRYFHDAAYARALDGSLVSNPIYPVGSYNDQHYPELESFHFDQQSKLLSIALIQHAQGGFQNRISLKGYELRDENGEKTLSPIEHKQTNSQFDLLYDLTQLPHGMHKIYFFAEENHGPSINEYLLDYLNDKEAPEIEFGYDGADLEWVVEDLRKVEFTLTDDSAITDIRVKLSGSRFDVDYLLGYSHIRTEGQSTSYSLELPKLFPNLGQDEDYHLEVLATDEFGNSQVSSVRFNYQPENYIQLGKARYLPTKDGVALYRANGEPLAVIESQYPLSLDDSMLATGDQDAEITVDASSDHGIKIMTKTGWVEVMPGMTKMIVIDLGLGERLNVEVYPAIDELKEDSHIDMLFHIPQLSSKFVD